MAKATKEIKLLRELIQISSPSGFEQKFSQYIRKLLLQYLPKTKVLTDFQNNVIAIIKGTQPDKTVMIDAHLDDIGFIVTNIDKAGFINIDYIGGGDTSILSARELIIITDKKKINAVVNRKHTHLIGSEEDEAIGSMKEVQVDIGIRKRKQVQRHVKIGDPVVYRPAFYQLMEDYYSGYGFDDKAGCFILINAIKEIVKSKRRPIPNLIFTFSAQEETGYSKALPLVRKYKPNLFIEVDVTFATDYLDGEMDKEAGGCELGKGIVIYRGVDIHRESLKLLESTARRNKIKLQYQASTGRTAYTASDVTQYNTRGLIVAIPLRNMHTPVEVINMRDLKYGTLLLKNYLLNRKLGRVIEK